jgi:hypothetical protein
MTNIITAQATAGHVISLQTIHAAQKKAIDAAFMSVPNV